MSFIKLAAAYRPTHAYSSAPFFASGLAYAQTSQTGGAGHALIFSDHAVVAKNFKVRLSCTISSPRLALLNKHHCKQLLHSDPFVTVDRHERTYSPAWPGLAITVVLTACFCCQLYNVLQVWLSNSVLLLQGLDSDAFTFEAWVSTSDYCHRCKLLRQGFVAACVQSGSRWQQQQSLTDGQAFSKHRVLNYAASAKHISAYAATFCCKMSVNRVLPATCMHGRKGITMKSHRTVYCVQPRSCHMPLSPLR